MGRQPARELEDEVRGIAAYAAALGKADDPDPLIAELILRVADTPVRETDLAAVLKAFEGLRITGETAQARACWARSLLISRFGADRRALRLLEYARDILLRTELYSEIALLHVDLVDMHWRHGDHAAVREYAAHAVMRHRDHYPSAVLIALLFLRDAAVHHELTDKVIYDVRRAVAWNDLAYLDGSQRAPAPIE